MISAELIYNLIQWCLAWKNVKAGTKYNKLVRAASLGKVNDKGKTEKYHWTALYSNCIVEYSIKAVRCLRWIALTLVGTQRGRPHSGA